jgi:hypothetical protein
MKAKKLRKILSTIPAVDNISKSTASVHLGVPLSIKYKKKKARDNN